MVKIKQFLKSLTGSMLDIKMLTKFTLPIFPENQENYVPHYIYLK